MGEGCKVEFTDLGVATATVDPVPKQRPQQQQEETEAEPERGFNMIAVISFVSVFCVMKLTVCCYLARSGKKSGEANYTQEPAKVALPTPDEGKALEEVTASMEEGKTPGEKKSREEEIDNNSTVPPSSDKQSDPSLNGDAEEDTKSDLSVLKALSAQDI